MVNADLKRGTSEKHSRILEQHDVFEVLLKFIQGKIRTIAAGPKLWDAECSKSFTLHDSDAERMSDYARSRGE